MVGRGTSGGECYGWVNDTAGTGGGAGYLNACIHSDSNSYTNGNTVWYNYVAATAKTITGTNNIIIATESICPKGWSLPSKMQTNILSENSASSTYVSIFTPVLGGTYGNGGPWDESTAGAWQTSDAYNDPRRYRFTYNGTALSTSGSNARYGGFYIRCVSEEKDVSDLTYMQDMTPSVATNTAEGATARIHLTAASPQNYSSSFLSLLLKS